MKRLRLVVLCLVAFFAVSAVQAKSTKLEYKFRKNQKASYSMCVDVGTSVAGMPSSQALSMGKTTIKMTADIAEKVVSVCKDGSALLRVTTSNIHVSVLGMPSPAMKTTTVMMTVAKNGKVLKGSLLQDLDSPLPIPCETMMSQWIPLPAGQVAVGKKWERATSLDNGGSLRINSVLEAAAVPLGKEIAAKIGQTVKGNFDLSSAMAEATGNRTVSMKSAHSTTNRMFITGKSVCHFSPSQGKLLKSAGKFKGKMKILLPAGEKQSTPVDVVMDMTVSVVKTK